MAILVCPTCSTQYHVDNAKLAKVKTFRCRRCNTSSPVQGNVVTEDSSKSSPSEDEFAVAEKMLGYLETTEDIDIIFGEEGTLVEVRGNNPLLLNTSDYVWLVNTGNVDIFSVHVEHGETVGSRRHLVRLEPGHIFFGIDSEQYDKERALIAVGTIGSSVLQLDAVRLKKLTATQEFTAIGFAALVEQWIATLLLSVRQTMIPKDCRELQTFGKIQFEQNVNYKPQTEVGWVKHKEGTSILMGIKDFPEIQGDGYFPVYKKTWLQTTSKVILDYTSTSGILTQDIFWTSLEQFHLFFLDCLIIHAKQDITTEQKRLEQKAEDERSSFKNALLTLVSVVGPKHGFIHEITGEPLLATCRILGKYLNISFIPPPDSQKKPLLLADIVRASRVRFRRVVLRGAWWRQDNGPLLGIKEQDKRPVALIPKSAGTYILVDPIENTQTQVTTKVADSLMGISYTFYRSFPARVLAVSDILKEGFRGTGKDILMVVIVGILGTLLGMLTPMLISIIFDTVIPGAAISQLVQIGVILLVCALARAIFELTKSIAMLRIEGKSDYVTQAALWDRLLSLPTSFFREYSAGDLAVRSMGISAIRQILAGVTMQSVLAAIFSLGYLILLFRYDWFLALIAIGIGLVAVLVTVVVGYFNVRYQKPLNAIEGKISGLVLQLITGIGKLRITGTEDRAFAVWAREFSAQRKLTLKSRKTQHVLATFNSMLPVFTSMIFFYFVLSKIMDPSKQGLSTGNLLAFLAAYGTFQGSLIQMSSALLGTLQVVPFYQRLKPILTTLPEVDATKSHPGEITGNIEITQVNFRYKPDGPLVLKNVSLNIPSGDFVAIVGPSGSGKSTLMRLLLGFETPESGSIYYDGQDLSNVDVLEIRRQMGVVLQNSQIMAGSIFDNIVGAGSATLTLHDAWEAARMAGCYEDIRAMPMQMHTVLPPGGGSLSGGQRQRIIIARAVVKKPRILIFDEATSALDNQTQQMVSESIEKLQATRIVIAHRLSTIINADMIYVMDKGQIVQRGTYRELISQEGLFAELARRQTA
jgi:NHLM bacteriocin system ABC transporter ATP-binding protein